MTASVLVVEDERKIRDLLRSYLEHDGLAVITTGSGAEAIQLARETAPDLIVLDLRLPMSPGRKSPARSAPPPPPPS
jgi:DNA-binding response OmpR family regulator